MDGVKTQPMSPQEQKTTAPVNASDPARLATAFVIKLVVLGMVVGLAEAYLHMIGWGEWLQHGVASVSWRLASLFTPELRLNGVDIIGGEQLLAVTLECTALFPKGLFCVAVIAYPAGWRMRIVGLVMGIVGVAILNVVRIAGLALISLWIPSMFHFAHLVLMQWFLISCVAPLWLAWAVWTTKRPRVTHV